MRAARRGLEYPKKMPSDQFEIMTVNQTDLKKVEQRRHTESVKRQHQVFDCNKEVAVGRNKGKRLALQKPKQDGQNLSEEGETSQPDLPAKRLDMAEDELTISQSKYNLVWTQKVNTPSRLVGKIPTRNPSRIGVATKPKGQDIEFGSGNAGAVLPMAGSREIR